ncbi:MAG: hypothetical protein KY439_01400 [Actinobacteria bacterium]|nr:hypothetical protein [Actinomycetota bacterium]
MIASTIEQLCGLLSREREVLDLLAGSLAGDLPASSPTTEELLRSISSLELHRAIIARELALELGVSGDPTLQELSERAPREWKRALLAQLRALRSLAQQVQALSTAAVRPEGAGASVVVLPVAAPRMIQRSLREFLASPLPLWD